MHYLDVEIPKDTGDFRLVDRKVVDVINQMPEHNKFLRGLFSWVGFEQIPYEYERQERFAGKTKYPLKKMIKISIRWHNGIFNKTTKISWRIGNYLYSNFNNNFNLCSFIIHIQLE